MKSMEPSMEAGLRGGEYRKFRELQFASVREKYNLKMIEIDILYFLHKYASLDTSSDIREKLSLNKGHISQAIDALVKKQYICVTADEKDHRYAHYSLTDTAMPAVEQIAMIRQSIDGMLFKNVSEEDLAVYKKVALQMYRNIKDVL